MKETTPDPAHAPVPHNREAVELQESPYQIVRVPSQLHQNWMDIGYGMQSQGLRKEYVWQATVDMLRKWFQSVYSAHKLCGYEEFLPSEIEALGLSIKPGFYIRIRPLSPDELREALDVEAEWNDPEQRKKREELNSIPGVKPRYNPRWVPEGGQGYLNELREPNPEKYFL